MHAHQAQPRPDLPAPPAHAVDWIVSKPGVPRREVTIRAQLWAEARARGAAALGVNTDQVRCVQAGEPQLAGSGRA